MNRTSKLGLGVASAFALALLPTLNANADVQAQAGDIVGVGSDTVQYLGDFIADGDFNGHTGYNPTHLSNRLVNFHATGDAFGSLTAGVGIVERAGQKPTVRPDGSGTGYDAINADTAGTINYVRASGTPNAARVSAANAAFGGYHAYRVATDDVRIGVSGLVPSEVPANLTTSELATLYSANAPCPTFAAAIGRGPANPAHPVIPQSGSGTRNSFLASIGVPTPGTCAATVQEHDPKPIRSDADAFGPFSAGRLSLINAGYFTGAGINAGDIVVQSAGFPAARPLYLVLKQNDLTNSDGSVKGVPNATTISALFAPAVGAYTRSSASALFASAGFTRSFLDCEASGSGPNTFC